MCSKLLRYKFYFRGHFFIYGLYIFYRFTKEEFIALKACVIKNFPNEDPGVFYVPGIRTQVARGKLYSAYQFYRRQLGAVGLAELRQKTKKTNTIEEIGKMYRYFKMQRVIKLKFLN